MLLEASGLDFGSILGGLGRILGGFGKGFGKVLEGSESFLGAFKSKSDIQASLVNFSRFPNFTEHQVRKLVGMAVDNSIVEILPPVVDRSVTIALITTRELVLKDFAHDGDDDVHEDEQDDD